jgi:hypothetical protein
MSTNKAHKPPLPWIMRLPTGLREQPAWVFIGILVGLAGVGYLTGLTESSISQTIGTTGLRVWGAFLAFSGFAVTWATIRASPVLEKLALRILSLCLFVYGGWLSLVIDFKRVAMSLVLILTLIFLAEVRVAVLRALFKTADDKRWSQW